jgi:hypothetical protein
VLSVAVAVLVFVVVDPHIWPNPPVHVEHFFTVLIEGIVSQQQAFPDEALADLVNRARYVLEGALIDRTASGRRGWPFEIVLAAIGISALAWRTWRCSSQTGLPPPEGLILIVAVAYLAGPSLVVHMAWPRYVLPSLLVGAVLSGFGISVLLQGIKRAVPAARGDRLIARLRA